MAPSVTPFVQCRILEFGAPPRWDHSDYAGAARNPADRSGVGGLSKCVTRGSQYRIINGTKIRESREGGRDFPALSTVAAVIDEPDVEPLLLGREGGRDFPALGLAPTRMDLSRHPRNGVLSPMREFVVDVRHLIDDEGFGGNPQMAPAQFGPGWKAIGC